jgi:hypothetical protein
MIAFLDFEASSLGKKSFPVEVAWVFQDGRSRSILIKPIEAWTDWSEEAENLHGLSRKVLEAEGVPVASVAAQMMDELSGHQLYASAPSWDGKWLSALLRGAGLPRHSLRLRKSDEAFLDAARIALGTDISNERLVGFVAEVIERTEPKDAPAHRALPDAQLELQRWRIASAASGSPT